MSSLEASTRNRIRRRLLSWYKRSRRDLPWRRTDDPYRIWLSEAMLQQTRVETVIPYYERFCERFPTVEALAAADEQDVLREWAGLGYYARARNLRRAAQIVVAEHGGRVPSDADALSALPGVGPYTVGALRSIAFAQPAAIVDGNVTRVISRLFAEPHLPTASVWKIAAQLVPGKEPGLFNQGLMELGATLCTPRQARCCSCPLRDDCAAGALGTPEKFPAPRTKPRVPEVNAICGLLRRRDGALLMMRRPARGLLGGLWEMPSVLGEDPRALVEQIALATGLNSQAGPKLGGVRHVFSHRALTLSVLELRRVSGRLRSALSDRVRWCSRAELSQLPLSKLTRKALACGTGSGPEPDA